MAEESVLREIAREAIRSGKIPTRAADRVEGGPGSGAVCAICGDRIRRLTTELELDFNRHATPGTDKFFLHHRCFAAWEFERTKV